MDSASGSHCTDFTNFERTADFKSSSPSKFVKNSTSNTAIPRILEEEKQASLRALAQDKAWQSIHFTHNKPAESKRHKLHTSTYSLHTFLESTFDKTQMDCHADFQSARNDRKPSPHTLESTFSHDTPFLSSRDFRKEVVAIHKSAKADSKKNTQKAKTLESTFEKMQMDCHADFQSARNDRENAPTLKTPQAQAKLDSRNEAQNLKTPAKDSRICDEKSGLSSDWQGSYLSGDLRQSRRIHDLSRKAESTSQIY
ncbi:hypothetical protein [Helicobacter canis]|uniref:hypothetical protein n=1 Tax=Helicobacter canis TaxID=29419 RepID=UPI00040D60FB|nr:hypothetical protein [Helicobacter canis]